MKIEEAIKTIYVLVGKLAGMEGKRIRTYVEALCMAIYALNAQQEEEKEPCDFCERYDFGSVKTGVDKYEAYLHFSGGSRRFPLEEQFNFCPVCGRELKAGLMEEVQNE